MAGHVSNPATKFEDPKPICSWVISYNVSHWLPLKMCTQPLWTSWITWPVSRVSKKNYIFGICDPDLHIQYTTFMGLGQRLRLVEPYISAEKKLSRKSAQKLSVLGVKGAKILNTGFMTPKRHILARNRVFWRTLRENRCARLGCRRVEEPSPKNEKIVKTKGCK